MTCKFQIMLLIALWAAPLLAAVIPAISESIRDELRRRDGATTLVLMLLIVAATLSVGRAIADKGGSVPTNQPPAAVSPAGRINLYRVEADGRMVPLDASIRRANP